VPEPRTPADSFEDPKGLRAVLLVLVGLPAALPVLAIMLIGLPFVGATLLVYWLRWKVFGTEFPVKIPTYRVSEPLAQCWWQPLESQGLQVSLISDIPPETTFGSTFYGRYVSNGTSKLAVEIGASLRYDPEYPLKVSVSSIRHGQGEDSLYRVIELALLASGARQRAALHDFQMLLTLPPGSEMETVPKTLSLLPDTCFGQTDAIFGKSISAWRAGHHRQFVIVHTGLAVEPSTRSLISYAALCWRRGFLGRLEKPTRQLAEELTEALVRAGARRVDPIIPAQREPQER
jgi:hypothetical protein